MSKSARLAINTLIVGVGKGVVVLSSFLVLPVYTRYMNTEQYGVLDLVMVYLALAVPLMTIRLDMSVFRWLVDVRGDRRGVSRVLWNIFLLLAGGLAVFTLIFWLVNALIAIPYAGYVYAYFILYALFTVILQVARGLGEIVLFSVSNVIMAIVAATVGVTLVVFFGARVEGVLIGYVAGLIFALLFATVKLRLWSYLNERTGDKKLRKSMIGFSLPMIPNGLSWFGIFAGTKLVISVTLGIAANGVYAVAGKFAALFSSLYDVFNTTWQESTSLHINSKDRDEYFSNTIDLAIRFFSTVAIGVVLILPLIFPILIDDAFGAAYVYIPFLLAAFMFDVVAKILGAIYIANRDTKAIMNTTLAAAAIALAGTVSLIGVFGLWAAVASTLLAYMILAIYRYIDLRRGKVNIRMKAGSILQIIAMFSLVTFFYYKSPSLVPYVVLTIAICTWSVWFNMRTIRGFAGLALRKK